MDYIQFKTVVPKYGDIETYKDKPLLDKLSPSNTHESKAIGVISDAVEIEEGYELTVNIFGKYKYEWIGGNELSAMSMGFRN